MHKSTEKFKQRTYHKPATEDPHEANLQGETMPERTSLDLFIFILPMDL